MDRTIVIFNQEPDASDNVKALYGKLHEWTGQFPVVFTVQPRLYDGMQNVIQFPDGLDTEPKRRNFVSQQYKTGFLHVILDTTTFNRDPSVFLQDLEKMMRFFDYSAWLSTYKDPCNFIYKKYNPRLTIKMDRKDVADACGLACDINFTSHSNTQIVSYDMDNVSPDLLRFDERFTIAMYWIIEFLARRRSTRRAGQLYYMNQYMSVASEIGLYDTLQIGNGKQDDQQQMRNEDTEFKRMGVDYSPDNNIDTLLEQFWAKVKEKSGIVS